MRVLSEGTTTCETAINPAYAHGAYDGHHGKDYGDGRRGHPATGPLKYVRNDRDAGCRDHDCEHASVVEHKMCKAYRKGQSVTEDVLKRPSEGAAMAGNCASG